MRKKLLVLLVLLTLGTGLYAQQAGQLTFGFSVGLARGFWSGLESRSGLMNETAGFGLIHYSYEDTNRFNFTLGFHYAYTFMSNLTLQVGFNIMVNQGFNEEWEFVPESGMGQIDRDSYSFTYTSVDFPVLLRYNFFHGLFGFLIGPHLSIPIDAGDYDVAALNVTFGITIGGQALFPIGRRSRLVGDLRFIADFNQVIDRGIAVSGLRRQALIITAGYEFSF